MHLESYLSQAKNNSEIATKSGEWLSRHKNIQHEINRVRNGISQLQFVIPIFGAAEGKEFVTVHPWHHLVLEAEQDLNSAFLLLLMGFYKDGFRAMRSFLELTLFALANFVEEDQEYFKGWLAGKRGTPKFADLVKKVSLKNGFEKLNEKLEWDTNVTDLYNELSGYIHTRGARHTNSSLRNSNTISFSESGMSQGMTLLLSTMKHAAEAFVVVFPMALQSIPLLQKFAFGGPVGGFLDEDQVESVKGIFEETVLDVLVQVSQSDSETVSLAESIRSMPDLSEEEIAESMKRTLESEYFASCKEMVINLLKQDKVGEAIAHTQAIQRAMMHGLTSVLFNPFHAALVNSETKK